MSKLAWCARRDMPNGTAKGGAFLDRNGDIQFPCYLSVVFVGTIPADSIKITGKYNQSSRCCLITIITSPAFRSQLSTSN